MLQEIIDTFETIKKNVYIIDRKAKGKIIITFKDEHFYHLVGLHKINFDMFIPNYIKTKEKQYKYIKSHVNKYDKILQNQIAKKDDITRRLTTLPKLLKLLEKDDTKLYNLKERKRNSRFDSDYGLANNYENLYYLLGLKEFYKNETIVYCAPQSWIANRKEITILQGRPPHYFEKIIAIPTENFDDNYI